MIGELDPPRLGGCKALQIMEAKKLLE